MQKVFEAYLKDVTVEERQITDGKNQRFDTTGGLRSISKHSSTVQAESLVISENNTMPWNNTETGSKPMKKVKPSFSEENKSAKISEKPTKKSLIEVSIGASTSVTKEWLEQCVAEMSNKTSKPFHTERMNYAVGDCIKMCNKCEWGNGHRIPPRYLYPNWTIAGSYAQLACPENNPRYVSGGNLTLIDQVFHQFEHKKGFVKPDPDAIILHLRLGDMIEKSFTPVSEMLIEGGTPRPSRGQKSIKSFYEFLDNIEESNTSKVMIIGGSHVPQRYKKSRVYAGCLKKALVEAGKDVTMELDGGNADKDFYMMSHAKKIVVTMGGYSKLIGQLVEYYGGTVYGRQFDSTEEIKKFEETRAKDKKRRNVTLPNFT